MNQYIKISAEVQQAMKENRPIVAIETGGTFEGFPYPENVEVARKTMDIIRGCGAVPAHICIMDGFVHVGLSDEQVEQFAKISKGTPKISVREIPQIVAMGKQGIMTIGGTMFVADYLQIPVVVGCGIGGVHRDGENTMDISADLDELAMRNVVVVCSGAKSILDLQLTMEYLETKSVAVIGFGTDELPAYMARESGIKVPCRMDDVEQVAKAYNVKNSFGIKAGMLLTNPVDKAYAVDADEMNRVIEAGIAKSKIDGVSGKEITAYLMGYLKENMGSDSSEARKHMTYDDAKLAGQLACTLHRQNN